MKTLDVALSDARYAMVEGWVAQGGYANVEDYLAALIEKDLHARAQQRQCRASLASSTTADR